MRNHSGEVVIRDIQKFKQGRLYFEFLNQIMAAAQVFELLKVL